MERITLKIDGMSCGGCVRQVTKALTKVPGVSVEQVQVGTATVSIDPQTTSKESLLQTIRDAGYDAKEIATTA
jgi:copper chaperone